MIMSQEYYTYEQLDAYMAEHNVSSHKARAALRKMGFTRQVTRRQVTSQFYTHEEVIALAEARGITLTSAKSYLKRNFKGDRKLIRPKSIYFTDNELELFMEETGKSLNNAKAILRYRALNPKSIPKPVVKPVITDQANHSFTNEQIAVYMYQSGCTQEDALYNMCREQIIPQEYPSEHWRLLNNKWSLITHNYV